MRTYTQYRIGLLHQFTHGSFIVYRIRVFLIVAFWIKCPPARWVCVCLHNCHLEYTLWAVFQRLTFLSTWTALITITPNNNSNHHNNNVWLNVRNHRWIIWKIYGIFGECVVNEWMEKRSATTTHIDKINRWLLLLYLMCCSNNSNSYFGLDHDSNSISAPEKNELIDTYNNDYQWREKTMTNLRWVRTQYFIWFVKNKKGLIIWFCTDFYDRTLFRWKCFRIVFFVCHFQTKRYFQNQKYLLIKLFCQMKSIEPLFVWIFR